MSGVHVIAPPEQGRYRAFLSYSHEQRRTALAVQRAALRIGRAWYRRPTIAIFRDDTSLSAGALEAGIEGALTASDYLVLLASPAAAASQWVQREVEWWVDNRDADRALILLLDGELAWDDDRRDFTIGSTAVPEPLRGAYRNEPRWVDLRPASAPHRESLADPVFHDRIADLAATLYGCAKDELVSEELRQNRRWTRLRNAAIGVLAILLVLATVASVVAFVQLGIARTQTSVAESGEFSARAESAPDPMDALALSIDAEQRTDPPLPLSRRAYAGAVQRVAAMPVRPSGPPTRVAAQSPTSMAFSPDGSTLAVATGASGWELRDARTGASLPGRVPSGSAPSADDGPGAGPLSLSPDGRRAATTDDTLGLRIWDVASGRQVGPLLERGLQRPYTSMSTDSAVAWSPRGDRIAVASTNASLLIWTVGPAGGHGEPLRIATAAISDVAWSADGRRLATTGWDGSVRFFDTATGRAEGRPVPGPGGLTYGAVAWSPNGRSLAVAGPSGVVIIGADGQSGPPRRLGLGQDAWVEDVAWSPDSTRLATVRSGLSLWDAATGERIGDSVADVASSSSVVSSRMRAVAWSPDGGTIATATIGGSLRLWQVAPDPRSRPAGRSTDAIRSASWTPDSRGVHLDGDDATELWMIDGVRASRTSVLRRSGTGDAVPSPDGGRFAVSTVDDQGLTVQDTRTGAVLQTLRGQQGGIGTVLWNPRGRYLATLDFGGSVWLWDTDVGAPVGPAMTEPGGQITSVGWSPDGRQLVTGDRAGTVRVWRFSDVTQTVTLADGMAGLPVVWSPDGRRVATADRSGFVQIIDVETHARVRAGDVAGLAPSVVWHPSGDYVAITLGSTVEYVDAASGTEIAAVALDSPPTSIAFSPDGTRLLVATGNDFRILGSVPERASCAIAGEAIGTDALRSLLGAGRTSACIGPAVSDRMPLPLTGAR